MTDGPQPPTSLDQLALNFGTDKSSKHHGYTRIYETEFGRQRDAIKGILEIGVGGQTYKGKAGSSLQMWAGYFPNALIVGIDNDPTTDADYGDRIRVVIGDQTSRSALDRALSLLPSVDIIVDDGSHQNNLTIATFEYLFNFLRPGGVYVIEDTLCIGESKFSNTRADMEFFLLKLIKGIETNGRILTKGNNSDFKKIPSDYVMNVFERWIESVSIYRGLYFIRKRKI